MERLFKDQMHNKDLELQDTMKNFVYLQNVIHVNGIIVIYLVYMVIKESVGINQAYVKTKEDNIDYDDTDYCDTLRSLSKSDGSFIY